MRWLALTILLTPAAFSPVALAQSPIERALTASEVYWGTSRCQGPIVVTENPQTPSPAIPGTEVEAWVLFETPEGFMDWSSPTYSSCTINLSESTWPNERAMKLTYPEFCQVMVHEYGHFVGFADSTSYPITDIRYPVMSQANVPTICLQKPVRAHLRRFER
jgi:hypothetical protein